jgi:hypothetical protein
MFDDDLFNAVRDIAHFWSLERNRLI